MQSDRGRLLWDYAVLDNVWDFKIPGRRKMHNFNQVQLKAQKCYVLGVTLNYKKQQQKKS